jgi:hypothetical protein
MMWRVRDRQQQETDSDMRAVALTGDAEALARGLTKIYVLSHVPRRVDATTEQHATHPSLARRIRAIRGALAATPAPDALDTRFASTDGTTAVTFGSERLEWREGDAAVHSLSYAHLAELRLTAGASGATRLRAVERAGRQWEMTLVANDVARAQSVLDLFDGQLPDPVPQSSTVSWAVVRRVVMMIVASLALMAGQLAAGIVAFLAMMRPAPPLVAATGVAAIAASALMARDTALIVEMMGPWLPITLALAGCALLWLAWTARTETATQNASVFLIALGGLATLAVAEILLGGLNPVLVHQAARTVTAATIMPLALAGALTFFRSRVARISAVAVFVVGLVAAAAGSMAFLDRFGRDPLLVASETFTRVDVVGQPVEEFTLPFYATDIRLSPGGVHVAALGTDANGDTDSMTFYVGRRGEALSPIVADDLVFLDDAHAVLIESRGNGIDVQELSLDPKPTITWRQHVPDIRSATLSIRPEDRRWRVIGSARRDIVRAEGVIGGTNVETTQWPAPEATGPLPRVISASGSSALVVETHFDADLMASLTPWRWIWLPAAGIPMSQVWRVAGDSRIHLGASYVESRCFAGALADDRLVCTAFDGTRTRLTSVDPATGRIDPIGTLEGRFASYQRATTGWLTGWCDSGPIALRLATRELVAIPMDRYHLTGITTSDKWFGAVVSDGGRLKVRLFPLSATRPMVQAAE